MTDPTTPDRPAASSPLRGFVRLMAFLALFGGLIGCIRLFFRYQHVQELRQHGLHLTGTVADKDVTYTKSGKYSRERHDYVNFHTTLDGQPLHTPLDEARDIIDELQPGQPLEVVYLPADKWKNADGQVGFFDDHRPVPLAYVQQNPFTSSFAWLTYALLGGALLGLLLTRR